MAVTMENRDFKGVWIPKEIWLSKELKPMEKFFLLEIDSLDGEKGCWASNAHFSELFDISKGRCTQIIKKLESDGWLKVELIKKGKQVEKRIIRVVNKLNDPVNKLNTPSEKIKHPYLENDEGNNTKSNNTKSNKRNGKKEEDSDSHLLVSDVVDMYHESLPHLPKVLKITPTRERQIKKLLAGDLPCPESWRQFFAKAGDSKFLMGTTTAWKADLEWLTKAANALKVAEGRYDNKQQQSSHIDDMSWADGL